MKKLKTVKSVIYIQEPKISEKILMFMLGIWFWYICAILEINLK